MYYFYTMQDFIQNLTELAKDKHKENKTVFTKLKKKPLKQLDYIMQALHDEEFERANYYKTTDSVVPNKYVVRIVSNFRLEPSQFIAQYLAMVEDKDDLLKKVPFTFFRW